MSTPTDPDLHAETSPTQDPGPEPKPTDAPRTAPEPPADDDRSPVSEKTPQSAWGLFHSFEERGMPPPAENTLTDTHSCARLLSTFSDRLVVASTPGTDLPPVLYVADPGTGLVGCGPDRILALSIEVADDLLSDYEELYTMAARAETDSADAEAPPPLPSRRAVINHARGLRSARAPERHQKVVGGVLLHDMQMGGTLASRLTVVPHAQLDADMSVIGTAGGVLDIRSLRILPPSLGGTHFISRNTGVHFHRGARNQHVDRILPAPDAVDHQSRTGFIMRWMGWHMTHSPRRDLLGLIAEGNSGKTTLMNCVQAGLGDYAHVIRPQALGGTRSSSDARPGAHNDELLHFGYGRRLVVVPESGRLNLNRELLNRATGGDRLPTRPIRRAAVQVTVTAALVVVGNTPGPGQSTGAVLGIGGNDETSAALRDRARIVRLPRRGEGAGSPPDDKQLAAAALPTNWTQGFREAALARLLEWAVLMIDQDDPPERTAEMVSDQAHQESAERTRWEAEFIPGVLTQDPARALRDHSKVGRTAPGCADSHSVYQLYLIWHQTYGGDRPPAPQRAVTDALLRHYPGLRETAREGKTLTDQGGGRHKTTHYDGYYIREPGANEV